MFDRMGLDPRLTAAIAREGYSKPTLVQAEAIPTAIAGKDILVRSRTGSGKTAAYLLPILDSIIRRNTSSTAPRCTSALILVPTWELAGQVLKSITALTTFCEKHVRAENVAKKEDDGVQRARLAEKPDIVIATPGRVARLLKSSVLSLDNMAHLVIDEADLILSYGYDDDLEVISGAVPKGVQIFLMSATLRADVGQLKGLFCRNPVVLELDDQEEASKVTQYVVKCGEDEKFLLIYAIFMLKLVKGKAIVFVGDIDRCYRLKLFLEQFGIRSCVLNSELPVNSRIHVVEEFNKGVYDIIIATDEHEVLGNEETAGQDAKENIDQAGGNGRPAQDSSPAEPESRPDQSPIERQRKRRKTGQRDKDYGVARGIDFQNVACVLNFDLPPSSKSYTHRVGRTARGGASGIALSFVVPSSLFGKHKPTSVASAAHDEAVLCKIEKAQAKRGHALQPYEFDMAKLAGFRYRLASALAAVTPRAVRAARLRELKHELLNSDRLKRHFEENPDERAHLLRHDAETRAARVQPHLRNVPEYLLPAGGTKAAEKELGFVGSGRHMGGENRIRRARALHKMKGKGRRDGGVAKRKTTNPLRNFRAGPIKR